MSTPVASAQNSFAQLKERFRATFPASIDYLYRDKSVSLDLFLPGADGKLIHKETVSYFSNRRRFCIETLDVESKVKVVTLLMDTTVANVSVDANGNAVLTSLTSLPAAAVEESDKVAWYTLNSSMEDVGIGLFRYGRRKKSIPEEFLDPKAPEVPPHVSFSIADDIRVVFKESAEKKGGLRVLTNGAHVLLLSSNVHSPTGKIMVVQTNSFDGRRPLGSEVYVIDDADGKRSDWKKTVFTRWEEKTHDDSFFKLSRYGLPDIDDGELPPQLPYMLYAGLVFLAVVLTGLAVILFRRLRQDDQ
jgi:hypothetical protein